VSGPAGNASGRCGFDEGTFRGIPGDDGVAPKAVTPDTVNGRRGSTLLGHSAFAPGTPLPALKLETLLAGSEPAELVWEADIRTGFLRELRDCLGNAGTAVRNSWIPVENSGDSAGRATLGEEATG
jgi:hypothetical protein